MLDDMVIIALFLESVSQVWLEGYNDMFCRINVTVERSLNVSLSDRDGCGQETTATQP
jgi:hypothetical protein